MQVLGKHVCRDGREGEGGRVDVVGNCGDEGCVSYLSAVSVLGNVCWFVFMCGRWVPLCMNYAYPPSPTRCGCLRWWSHQPAPEH